jgi:hypothetical protein
MGPAEAEGEQAQSPESEAPEDATAELDLRDQQCAEALGANQDAFHRTLGLDVQEGVGSRQLPDLRQRVARSLTIPDRNSSPERIAPGELHTAREHDDHPRPLLAHLEEHGAVGVAHPLPEASEPRDVALRQGVEDLVKPSLEEREVRAGRERGKIGNRVAGGCHGDLQ